MVYSVLYYWFIDWCLEVLSMTDKRFKLFVGNNYGVKTMDGEVIFDSIRSISDADVLVDLLNELVEENEQLKERNDRQAKRLGKLYELIAKKDWESLTEIIDDFKRCEEQLQREWRTYE